MQIDAAMPLVMPLTIDGSSALTRLPAVTARPQPAPAAAELPHHDRKPVPPEKALGEIAEAMQPYNISLKFSRDDETGTIVVQMIDQKSGETVQQMPTPASLHVFAALRKLQGKIINCNA